MLEIVDAMKEEEKANMCDNKEWIEKVKELVELGKDVDMFETLEKMLEILGPHEPRTSNSMVVEPTIGDLDGERTRKVGTERCKVKGRARDVCRGCGCGNGRCSSYSDG